MTEKRIRLRPLRRADKEMLYEWIVDRELRLFNSAYHPVSEADHEAWLEATMRKRQDLTIFVIEDCSSGVPIGTCQLLNIDWRHRNAELQIRIGSSEQRGRGLGTEAVAQLVDFGFRDLNLHRIYLHVFATNGRAIAAYRKCGFEIEGTLREMAFIDGAWVDVLAMSVLRLEHD